MRDWIGSAPKVELHVHLEGSIRPATIMDLAAKYEVTLPVSDPLALSEWCRFQNFGQFVKVFLTISGLLREADDFERIAFEFAADQAAQNIIYTEVTFTTYTHWFQKQIAMDVQLDAVNRGFARAEAAFGTHTRLVIDIPRVISEENALNTAAWVIEQGDRGVVALGLGGPEFGNPASRYRASFELALNAGFPVVPHAGETDGPVSVWSALRDLGACRIGHGVRALEDPELMAYLKEKQVPLEVCPGSNICLGVFPDMGSHPLKEMVELGLNVTLNSDDPTLFGTSLVQEWENAVFNLGLTAETLTAMQYAALDAALINDAERALLKQRLEEGFSALRKT